MDGYCLCLMGKGRGVYVTMTIGLIEPIFKQINIQFCININQYKRT